MPQRRFIPPCTVSSGWGEAPAWARRCSELAGDLKARRPPSLPKGKWRACSDDAGACEKTTTGPLSLSLSLRRTECGGRPCFRSASFSSSSPCGFIFSARLWGPHDFFARADHGSACAAVSRNAGPVAHGARTRGPRSLAAQRKPRSGPKRVLRERSPDTCRSSQDHSPASRSIRLSHTPPWVLLASSVLPATKP